MEIQRIVTDIFKATTERKLRNVSIRICENRYKGFNYVLYVGERDRIACDSLGFLLQSILEHKEDLSWMNE